MGERHASIYSQMKNVELIGICDPILEQADKLAKKYTCKSYSDVDSLLSNEVFDAASICTPNALHKESALKLLEHQKHLLIEKPLATTVTDCEEIISVSEKNNLNLMVGHTHRFYPSNLELKKILDKIGSVKIFTDYSLSPYKLGPSYPGAPDWVFNKDQGGGVLMDAVHAVDRIRWWLNSDFHSVNTVTIGNLRDSSQAEEFSLITFRLKNGVVGTLLPIGPSWGVYDAHINIIGKEGVIAMKYGEELKLGKEEWIYYDFEGKTSPPSSEHTLLGFKAELSEFVSSIIEKREPSVTGKDGLASLKVILAIHQSFRVGKPVQLDDL